MLKRTFAHASLPSNASCGISLYQGSYSGIPHTTVFVSGITHGTDCFLPPRRPIALLAREARHSTAGTCTTTGPRPCAHIQARARFDRLPLGAQPSHTARRRGWKVSVETV